MQQTINYIEINAPFEFVFKQTNDLKDWTNIFTEYASVDILEQQDNYFKFKLTTVDGKSWTSERSLYFEKNMIVASRISPLHPFVFMEIEWYYADNNAKSTRMVWIQKFEIAPESDHKPDIMMKHLNDSSAVQMLHMKNAIEGRFRELSKSRWKL